MCLLQPRGPHVCSNHEDHTYLCIREVEVDAAGSITRNYAYCHFAKDGLSEGEDTTEPFIEAYNLMDDPSQAINLAVLDDTDARAITDAERTTYEARITQLKGCAGQTQCA